MISLKVLKPVINRILTYFNLKLVNESEYRKMILKNKNYQNYNLQLRIRNNLKKAPSDIFLDVSEFSESQLGQDILVAELTRYKHNGFFVEFGATNGIDLSNSYMLETRFQWSGILAEPAKYWRKKLIKNRSCSVELNAVHSASGETIKFTEAKAKELSGLEVSKKTSRFFDIFKSGNLYYDVNTISLNDLLLKWKAPQFIDYISIDTEGTEFDILEHFDFSKWTVAIWTIEHNFSKTREAILELMTKNGYTRILSDMSSFDDWYVLTRFHDSGYIYMDEK